MDSVRDWPSFKSLPMGVRRELAKPLPMPKWALRKILSIQTMERDLLAHVLRVQREYNLPHRVAPISKKAKSISAIVRRPRKIGRPISDQPYPRVSARSAANYLAHWEHTAVHVEGCFDCYKREYMFFRRHPHLTARYLTLGHGEKSLIGREEPKIDQIPFGMDTAHRKALDRDVVRTVGDDWNDGE